MPRKLSRLNEYLRNGFHVEMITSDDHGIQVNLADGQTRLTITFSRPEAAELLFGAVPRMLPSREEILHAGRFPRRPLRGMYR